MSAAISFSDDTPVVLLDTVRRDGEGSQSLLFASPTRVIVAREVADVVPALEGIATAVRQGLHAAGFISYEAGAAFHPSVFGKSPGKQPLVWFGLFEEPTNVTSNVPSLLPQQPGGARISDVSWSVERSDYIKSVETIRHLIREGDVYQINYTAPFRFKTPSHPLALYARLRKAQRVPYAAYIFTGEHHVVSLSPELFFRRDGDAITTRPMKGTIRRGRYIDEDLELEAVLANDAKTQAENLMIVDLLRNDLSIVCDAGTVSVPRLFTIEKYETLFQMTSTVSGQLRSGIDYPELFRALFPSGSVTGAPKIRAMQRINELENGPRGVYCGAIGYIAPDRQACFSVAIRTIVVDDAGASMGTGSGIVWDSEPAMEYEECLLKTSFLTTEAPSGSERLQLIETMRWEGAIDLLDLHISRLAESATFFEFDLDLNEIRLSIEEATNRLIAKPHRVRFLVDRSGSTSVECTPIGAHSDRPLRAVFSDEPVDSADPYLFHKTTVRDMYETRYSRALTAGYDEALLVNMSGEVTEGTRTNVFIRKGEKYLTPARTCGLLAGVYRRHMLQSLADVEEAILYPRDLLDADELYLCNAVRGMRRAVVELA